MHAHGPYIDFEWKLYNNGLSGNVLGSGRMLWQMETIH